MDLFSFNQNQSKNIPLAEKYRPKKIENFKGLENTIERLSNLPFLPNLILWGPPGVGKTSLALLLASKFSQARFLSVNAVDTGAKKIKEIGEVAERQKIEFGDSTILFIDEIHRLNKAQQDVLLPFTEKGSFSLIGATTENPSFEINNALMSRCQLILLPRLTPIQLREILDEIFFDHEINSIDVLKTQALEFLIEKSEGDARKAINALDALLAFYNQSQNDTDFPLGVDELVEVVPNLSRTAYDKSSDEHYDCISAFIKSIRGSDPNAGLYYLARMLEGGEDPVFIARRLVVLASEDVGNADPRALQIAVSGLQAVRLVGLPEAGINLAQVVTYLASAPKSNRSYKGFQKALQLVKQKGYLEIPSYLKSSLSFIKDQKEKDGSYQYDHSHPKGHFKGQQFLPTEIKDQKIYEPKEIGFEKKIIELMNWLKG